MVNDVSVDNKQRKRDNKKFRKKQKCTNPNHRDHPAKGGKSAKRKPKQQAHIRY